MPKLLAALLNSQRESGPDFLMLAGELGHNVPANSSRERIRFAFIVARTRKLIRNPIES